VSVEQRIVSAEWDLRQRLAPLRERELRQALRRNRDLSEPTLEQLLDRAEEAVISSSPRAPSRARRPPPGSGQRTARSVTPSGH
jgi:hypothetical protein